MSHKHYQNLGPYTKTKNAYQTFGLCPRFNSLCPLCNVVDGKFKPSLYKFDKMSVTCKKIKVQFSTCTKSFGNCLTRYDLNTVKLVKALKFTQTKHIASKLDGFSSVMSFIITLILQIFKLKIVPYSCIKKSG